MQYFTICDAKKSWQPNYRINLLLFLNKFQNLISGSEIKLPNKKRIVDTIQIFSANLSLSNVKETKLFELVTGTEMKPWLLRNMLPNMNTCENWWSNFSANFKVVSLKFLELTHFAWPNLSIYFNFLCAVPRDDVIENAPFLMRPRVIIPPWAEPYSSMPERRRISPTINVSIQVQHLSKPQR